MATRKCPTPPFSGALTAPQAVKTQPVEELPVEYHSADLPHVADIIEWIGVEEDEICPLTNFDRSRIDVKEPPRVSSRSLKRFHWRQSGSNEELEFIVQARSR